jgi:RNA polymerase sigma-70 factor, ECF subfamily
MNPEKHKSKFEEIYNSQSDAVFRYCLFKTSNRETSIDLVQEIFMRFWSALTKEREIENHKAFLLKISRNAVIDHYRKKKETSLDEILEETEDSTALLIDERSTNFQTSADGRYALEKINELEPIHRQVIYLRFVEGLGPKEIGEILGISANTASVRVIRAIERLREITRSEIEEE